MRARGNTSSEASLVQCLCNSHGLVGFVQLQAPDCSLL